MTGSQTALNRPGTTGGNPFDNSYAALPEKFFSRLSPTPVAEPSLIRFNTGLAETLGLDPGYWTSPEGIEALSGNRVPEGADPIAQAYAGHQFGHFVPQLGDGRAVLLGEVIGTDGIRRDIQLKGSGRTPFSRGGDGRAAIGPVLREYIVSEAMYALGLPTTRALAATATGQPVYREDVLPGAVLTRVAQSHIRIGTFQFFAARRDTDAVKQLADYAIARHYPEAAETEAPYLAFLSTVIERQADLITRWMAIGFIHGVMNTDNMSIAGETIDFGPCAFMDEYHPGTVFSSIDQHGRYSYGNQPAIGQWNLAKLAECLLPLLDSDEKDAVAKAQDAVNRYPALIEKNIQARFTAKLGILDPRAGDMDLVSDLLELMAKSKADFTGTFRDLSALLAEDGHRIPDLRARFENPEDFDSWTEKYQARLAEDPTARAEIASRMDAVNPLYIPRNHLVEEALTAAMNGADYGPFEDLVNILSNPFEAQSGRERYTLPPTPEQVVHQTFCGT